MLTKIESTCVYTVKIYKKKPNYIFKRGGGGTPGAPFLDPPFERERERERERELNPFCIQTSSDLCMPVSSVSAERSFRVMRRLKTYLRLEMIFLMTWIKSYPSLCPGKNGVCLLCFDCFMRRIREN